MKRNNRDILRGKGFRMERTGRVIVTDTRRSASEQREIMTSLAKLRDVQPQSITRQVEELEEILSRYDPLDVIANFSFANLMVDPETYKEYAHEGLQAYVEYVTLLCLKRSYRTTRNRLIDAPALQDIQNRVKKIFVDTVWLYAAEHADPDRPGPPTMEQDLRLRSISHGLFVRQSGYHHHLVDLLRALFAPFAGWMQSELGFDVGDALAFHEAIERLSMDRYLDRRDHAHAEEKKMRQQVRRFRQGKTVDRECPHELVAQFAAMSDKEARRSIRNAVIVWSVFALGETCSFTAEQLGDAAGLAVGKADAYLRTMSLDFATIDRQFAIPSPTNPLQTRPIVHHDGRYLCPVPSLLLWSLRPALENLMHRHEGDGSSAEIWERYQRTRGDFLAKEALARLATTLRHAEVHGGLKYSRAPSPNGEDDELDGLIMFDNLLFLVECKAGLFSEAARRGAPKRMIRDLKKLLADAHSQALRARNYILEADEPVFRLPDGRRLHVDKQRIDTILLVTVTLEPLDVFTPVIHEVAQLGIFEQGDLPWAVYLLDLRVISELIEFPAQLVHFLKRRLRLNMLGKVHASDELDWLGHYLREGLYFEDVLKTDAKARPDQIALMSYTMDMDDYYLFETGQRKTPAPKPSQPILYRLRQIIQELEAQHHAGYVGVVCALLDPNWKTRKQFCKWFDKARQRSQRDGRQHDFSMFFSETATGVTVLTAKELPLPSLVETLNACCLLNKYRHKAACWVGLASHLAIPGLVHSWVVFKSPWEHDPNLEQAVAKIFPHHQPVR